MLPKGDWIFGDRAWYGRVHDVYLAVYSLGACAAVESADRFDCRGEPGRHGFVVEASDAADVEARLAIAAVRLAEDGDALAGQEALRAFAARMDARRPVWSGSHVPGGSLAVAYTTLGGDRLELAATPGTLPERRLNGTRLGVEDYAEGN